jgi:hypothetical protein
MRWNMKSASTFFEGAAEIQAQVIARGTLQDRN